MLIRKFFRKGDYYRYLAEFSQRKDRERFAELSLNAYKLAYKHALATLHPIHPTRLGLALNFAVFYHGRPQIHFSLNILTSIFEKMSGKALIEHAI